MLKKQWRNKCDDLSPALFGEPSTASRLRSLCGVPYGAPLNTSVPAQNYFRHLKSDEEARPNNA